MLVVDLQHWERPGWACSIRGRDQTSRRARVTAPRERRSSLGTPPQRDIRVFGLRRFPYRVVTAMVGQERLVIAIAHTRREPKYWLARLARPGPGSENWGGRATVFGSPWNYGSRLKPDEVAGAVQVALGMVGA